jgi:exodeoxyribonuclease VII large subunit
MLTVLSRRYPALEVVIAPVKVQGIGAAEEIVQAIEELNAIGGIDVIIVGRGGGSLEDLWAFNEEILARAIAASKIPIVSAVGHEIDFTISDFVADLRAPTPSAAAELIVRDRTELITSIRNYYDAISGDIVAYIVRYHDRLQGFMRSYALNMPLEMLKQRNQQTDDLVHRLGLSIQQYASMVRQHLTSLGQRLESLSPTNVLRRGYAIVTKGDTVITAARSLRPDEVIGVRFYRGTAEAIIKNVEGT